MPPEAAAEGTARGARHHRAKAIAALKQAIDTLFEAEPAARASHKVRALLAIANRPALRLVSSNGRPYPPPEEAPAFEPAQKRLAAACRPLRHGADGRAPRPAPQPGVCLAAPCARLPCQHEMN